MKLIVAVDEQWNIGRDNGLLFHIPEDMKYFQEKTTGKVVVMGEATMRSLPGGKPLPGRINIVLSDDPAFEAAGAAVVRTMDGLFGALKQYDSDDVFVIGGASVYNQLMDNCDTAYVTRVFQTAPADKAINSLDGRAGWRLEERSGERECDGVKFVFTVYKNDRAGMIE